MPKTTVPGKELRMSFDPLTIEHLGIKMYSNLPTALAELIANAYDADAQNVEVLLFDANKSNKSIVVKDDGIGMSFDEINSFFLRIGRNRRKEGYKETPSGRKATGKKGLGKLAFFGIGDSIVVTTIQKNSGSKISFSLNWQSLINSSSKEYKPPFTIEKCNKKLKGTTIELKELKRKSTFDKNDLAVSISKLFNFLDKKFKVTLIHNDERPFTIDNKLKFTEINSEFDWTFPQYSNFFKSSYKHRKDFNGKLFTSEKPLKPGLRGITLYANGRLVNAPEFFGATESSHFFSYLTGWLDVDFVDEWPEDVISTNRQTLNWDLEKTILLREVLKEGLNKVQKDWRTKRNLKREKNISSKTKIDINKWYNTLPPNIRQKMQPIVNKIVEESELTEAMQAAIVGSIHDMIPEYPNLHWRHLREEIRKASEKYYRNNDYYSAFIEALKRYTLEVRKKSGSTNGSDRSMMGEVFSGRKLSVTKKYKRTDGSSFSRDTILNIEEGQHYISEGIVVGGRNPLQHEEHIELSKTGLFSERDCLDFLSILSHLFKRLNDSEKP